MVGGRLQYFADIWDTTTIDRWVRDTVTRGYSLDLRVTSPNRFIQVHRLACDLKHQATLSVNTLSHIILFTTSFS